METFDDDEVEGGLPDATDGRLSEVLRSGLLASFVLLLVKLLARALLCK